MKRHTGFIVEFNKEMFFMVHRGRCHALPLDNLPSKVRSRLERGLWISFTYPDNYPAYDLVKIAEVKRTLPLWKVELTEKHDVLLATVTIVKRDTDFFPHLFKETASSIVPTLPKEFWSPELGPLEDNEEQPIFLQTLGKFYQAKVEIRFNVEEFLDEEANRRRNGCITDDSKAFVKRIHKVLGELDEEKIFKYFDGQPWVRETRSIHIIGCDGTEGASNIKLDQALQPYEGIICLSNPNNSKLYVFCKELGMLRVSSKTMNFTLGNFVTFKTIVENCTIRATSLGNKESIYCKTRIGKDTGYNHRPIEVKLKFIARTPEDTFQKAFTFWDEYFGKLVCPYNPIQGPAIKDFEMEHMGWFRYVNDITANEEYWRLEEIM